MTLKELYEKHLEKCKDCKLNLEDCSIHVTYKGTTKCEGGEYYNES